ncbi:MAG: hypothetical protein AB8B54_07665 [Sphingorhabdus sp.]
MRLLLLPLLAAGLLGNIATSQWQFRGPNPHAEPLTYAFISSVGDPQSVQGTKIAVVRDVFSKFDNWKGNCSFDNCSILIAIEGQTPERGATINALFSNGETLTWQVTDGLSAMHNYSRVNMATTNKFVQQVRAANWVEVSYGQKSHRFSLKGSSKALDGILPLIKVDK